MSPSLSRSAGDFRRFLAAEFARRRRGNRRYSLRAFAARLGEDHSTVSQWLRGKRPLTRKAVTKLGEALKLTRSVVAAFRKALAPRKPAGLGRLLARDAAQLLAQGHHFALLALLASRDFRADSRWIAAELGIPVDDVNLAVTRLARHGLMVMEARDRWVEQEA